MSENVEKASQLWCLPKHEHKIMDPDLCWDIVALLDTKDLKHQEEVERLLQIRTADLTAYKSKCEELDFQKQLNWEGHEAHNETGKKLANVTSENASLRKQLEDAKKCSVCGGTDVVCAKGWTTERDALKKQLEEAGGLVERANDALTHYAHFCSTEGFKPVNSSWANDVLKLIKEWRERA